MAVQAVTLADLETLARDHSQDNDATTANYALSSIVVKRHINRYYAAWKQGTDGRIVELTATVSGLTVAISGKSKDTTLAGIRRVLAAFPAASAGATAPSGDALERCKPWEIEEWRADYATTGTIARYAPVRLNSNANPPTPGFWRFLVHPTADVQQFILLRAEMETVLLSGATDVPECTDDECFGLAALVGAWMAAKIGRDWLVEGILAEVPPAMQKLSELRRKDRRPERRSDEDVA